LHLQALSQEELGSGLRMGFFAYFVSFIRTSPSGIP
jgi:hypothetical protein